MAFTSTITQQFVVGDRVCHIGNYVSDDGSTGGDIATGLRSVDSISVQQRGGAAAAAPAVNENIHQGAVGGAVTIVTAANATGSWIAFGRL